eukprot:CAMPEP_0197237504 /NCGR_PEP_ID=MMETSP1429-20130617/4318_1 /TAXON_ID=49237 /ORGANISM="Chaetoceros  sp., Strain UNC1202" /LENGTH=173 /DNA_ID=CAMNT_0042696519 /DNA_START=27 /DNA_END=545 /DNA_ORIENTATION=+
MNSPKVSDGSEDKNGPKVGDGGGNNNGPKVDSNMDLNHNGSINNTPNDNERTRPFPRPLQKKSSKSDNDIPDDSDPDLPFPTRYRLFSLRHCCIHLLDVDIQSAAHDPVMDAKYSLVLFQKYRRAPPQMLRAVRDSLHRSPITASYASDHPLVDGVCLSQNGYRLKTAARFVW